jgi:hypothetical protein
VAKTNAQKVFELTRFAAELVAQRHRRERPEATEDDRRRGGGSLVLVATPGSGWRRRGRFSSWSLGE